MAFQLFDPFRKKLHISELDLLTKMVDALEDEGFRNQIFEVLPRYRRVDRDVRSRELRFPSIFILGKAFNRHKPIPGLNDDVELVRAKLRFQDGTSTSVELSAVCGHLWMLNSRDDRVAKLHKTAFTIVWIKSIYDPTKPNPKVVAARKKYLPGLDLTTLDWARRSATSLELIDIDEKEYIMLWERGEEMLLGRAGKVYRYNMIDEDNLGVVTAEQLVS